MQVLALFCLVAAAMAAPWRDTPDTYGALSDYVSDDHIFDTNRFWRQLQASLMQQLLEDLYKHFPSDVTQEGVVDDQYRIVVPLEGYDEKDIVVKAQPGALMIQAVRIEGANKVSYLNARTLPADVDVAGRWGYEDGVLTIAFPLKNKTVGTTESELEVQTTGSPVSREELETESSVNVDERGSEAADMVGNNEITSNDIEDSTYAVDLKGDVEFVPIQVK